MGKLLRCRGTVPVGSFASLQTGPRTRPQAPWLTAIATVDHGCFALEHAIGQRFGINLRADLLVAVWFLPS